MGSLVEYYFGPSEKQNMERETHSRRSYIKYQTSERIEILSKRVVWDVYMYSIRYLNQVQNSHDDT